MSPSPRVAGIVLAAGASSRMGRTKQSLPFLGKTILEWVVDSALAASLHQVIVVLGHEAGALQSLLGSRVVDTVFNPDYCKGQSTSLQTGLKAITTKTDAVLFLLADQPLVTAETIDLILDAYRRSPESPIVLPTFEGRRGNPVLFGRETFPWIETLSEDCGARHLFTEFTERILKVPIADSSIHFDVDTEEAYRLLLQSALPPGKTA
jgi:molybdenum cofactor cytidylyltransferase